MGAADLLFAFDQKNDRDRQGGSCRQIGAHPLQRRHDRPFVVDSPAAIDPPVVNFCPPRRKVPFVVDRLNVVVAVDQHGVVRHSWDAAVQHRKPVRRQKLGRHPKIGHLPPEQSSTFRHTQVLDSHAGLAQQLAQILDQTRLLLF